jgi:hypothetical protein
VNVARFDVLQIIQSAPGAPLLAASASSGSLTKTPGGGLDGFISLLDDLLNNKIYERPASLNEVPGPQQSGIRPSLPVFNRNQKDLTPIRQPQAGNDPHTQAYPSVFRPAPVPSPVPTQLALAINPSITQAADSERVHADGTQDRDGVRVSSTRSLTGEIDARDSTTNGGGTIAGAVETEGIRLTGTIAFGLRLTPTPSNVITSGGIVSKAPLETATRRLPAETVSLDAKGASNAVQVSEATDSGATGDPGQGQDGKIFASLLREDPIRSLVNTDLRRGEGSDPAVNAVDADRSNPLMSVKNSPGGEQMTTPPMALAPAHTESSDPELVKAVDDKLAFPQPTTEQPLNFAALAEDAASSTTETSNDTTPSPSARPVLARPVPTSTPISRPVVAKSPESSNSQRPAPATPARSEPEEEKTASDDATPSRKDSEPLASDTRVTPLPATHSTDLPPNSSLAAPGSQVPRLGALDSPDEPITPDRPVVSEIAMAVDPKTVVSPQPAREISLRLTGEDSTNVDVQLRERAGQIQVAVRTDDPQLAKSLQSDLGELISRLESSGYKTEGWTPVAGRLAAAAPAESGSLGSQGQPQHSGSGSGQQQRQEEKYQSNQRQQPKWMAQVEETLSNENAGMESE